MENSAANQLPEVDSLPDGFVEGPSVLIAPTTPSNEKENPLADYKEDNISESDTLNYSSNEVSTNEFIPVEEKADKVRKLRTFPVPLSDKDDYDASRESGNVPDEGFLNEREDALGTNSESSTSVSEASAGCHLRTSTTDGREKCQSEFQSSKKVVSNAEANIAKEAQLSDNQTTRKEMAEGKRKNSKRTVKTEQEFLQFTLKYQQVLAERDAAIAVRDKLESLCRELQRQNKMLMDECKRVSEEGQNQRLDLSTKFQDAIKDVSNRLEEQKGECLSQIKENEITEINFVSSQTPKVKQH